MPNSSWGPRVPLLVWPTVTSLTAFFLSDLYYHFALNKISYWHQKAGSSSPDSGHQEQLHSCGDKSQAGIAGVNTKWPEEQAQLVSVTYSDPGSIAFKDGHMLPSTDQITTSACGMEGFVMPSGGPVLSSMRRSWQGSLLGDDRHSECPRTGIAGLLTLMRFGPCWVLPTFCGIVNIPYMSISTSSLLS